jgi:Ras-related protein Rab-1A
VKYESPEKKTIPVKIWDTAGQERFKTITYSFYRQAQGVLVTFDVTNRDSFENVKNWIDSIENHAKPNITKILIGNKIDLEDQRVVSKHEAQRLAEEHGMPFFETSAKMDQNVSEVIHYMIDEVYEKSKEMKEKEEIRGSLLNAANEEDKEKDDCKC